MEAYFLLVTPLQNDLYETGPNGPSVVIHSYSPGLNQEGPTPPPLKNTRLVPPQKRKL